MSVTIVMPNRPQPQEPGAPAPGYIDSEAVKVIARMLFKATAGRHGYRERTWEDLDTLSRTRFVSLAEFMVASLNPKVEAVAELETANWVLEDVRAAYQDDFREFPDQMVRDAVQSALSEYMHQVARAYRLIGGGR